MNNLKKYLMVGLKGACMGAADVIPGVSGGTIAFIMGIYDEFVGSIASINAEAVRLLLKGQFKAFWKHINGTFLVSLIAGIGLSVILIGISGASLFWNGLCFLTGHFCIIVSSRIVPSAVLIFATGSTIVASSIFILRGISGWKPRDILMLVLGGVMGVTVCTLSPTQTPDALWFIFLSGAIAICAMILPGISGSFILLILGKYQYIMGTISGLVAGENFGGNLLILCVFLVGAAVGILGFSKLLHWLLARWNKETLLVLAGFIIGSLIKVWPWSNPEALAQAERAGGLQAGWAILFALIGFCLVTGIELAGKLIKDNKPA